MSETLTGGTGQARYLLCIASNTRGARYASGTGTTSLVFRYTVVQADVDSDGITSRPEVQIFGGATIREAGGTANANLRWTASASPTTRPAR